LQVTEKSELLCGLRITVLGQIDFSRDDAIRIHSQGNVLQLPKTAQKQPGASQKNQRRSDLRRNECLAQKVSRSAAELFSGEQFRGHSVDRRRRSARASVGISKSAGSTPTIRVDLPSTERLFPTIRGSPAKRERQNPYERRTTRGPFGRSSSCVKLRPKIGCTRNVGRNAASACPQLSREGFCSVKSQSTLPGSTAVIASNGCCRGRQSGAYASFLLIVNRSSISLDATRVRNCFRAK
jgi:hypothetical protein